MVVVIKKLSISALIILLFLGGVDTKVEAESPNVKDCIENNEGCADPSTNEINDTSNEIQADSVDKDSQLLIVDLIKMVVALFLVLALIYFLLKFLNKRNNLTQQKSLQNMGGISVGPSKSVQIIKVGSRLYLIGVGDNVEMLGEITDEALINELLAESDEKDNFQIGTILSRLSKSKSKQDGSLTHPTDQQFKKMFSNELASLKENRNDLIKQHKMRKDNYE